MVELELKTLMYVSSKILILMLLSAYCSKIVSHPLRLIENHRRFEGNVSHDFFLYEQTFEKQNGREVFSN